MAVSLVALIKILIFQFMGTFALAGGMKKPFGKLLVERIFPLVACSLVAQSLAPNVWVIYVAIAAMMALFGTKAAHAAGTFLFLFVTIPAYPLPLQVGGAPLILLNSSIVISLVAGGIAIGVPGPRAKLSALFWLLTIAAAAFDVVSHARGTSITNYSRELIQTLLEVILPIVSMAILVHRTKDFRFFSTYVIATGMFMALTAAFEAMQSWNIYRSIYEHVGLEPVWFATIWRGGFMRATGPVFDATSMGIIITIFLLFVWCSRGVIKSTGWTFAITLILFLGIYFTQSRNPIIGTGIGISVWLAVKFGKKLGSMILYGAIGIAVAAIVVIISAERPSKVASNLPESTLEYRVRLFDRGVDEFLRHPIVGQSKPAVDARMEDLRQGEKIIDYVNSYLYVGLLSGIIGLTIFVGLFITLPAHVFNKLKNSGFYDPEGMSVFLLCLSISFITMSFFTWIFGAILPIYLLLQCALVGRLHRREALVRPTAMPPVPSAQII